MERPNDFGLNEEDLPKFFSYLSKYEQGGFIFPASMARTLGKSTLEVSDFLFVVAANSNLQLWSLPKIGEQIFEQHGIADLTTDPSKLDLEVHPDTMDPLDHADIEIICAFRFA